MSWENTQLAIEQEVNGVTGDKHSSMERMGSTFSEMGGVATQYGKSVKAVFEPVQGMDGTPWKDLSDGEKAAAVLRRTQEAVSAVGGALGVVQDMADVGFANLTAPLAALFPSLPAATFMSLYVGIPHAHAHPPSLVPPAPVGAPLPSLGPITLGNCVRVLINSKPAARAGDIGFAPTCGGLAPIFKVFLGSSNVFIGGKRAARVGDVCRVCTKLPPTPKAIPAGAVMSAVGKGAEIAGKVFDYAGKAGEVLGIAADAAEAAVSADDDAALSAAKAQSAVANAAQMAADIAAEAAAKAMGMDPAAPSQPVGIGAIAVPGSVNVLIGGFPMINIPNPAEALLNTLKRFKPKKGKGDGDDQSEGPGG